MRCVYCHEKAGFFKRTCPDCLKLVEAVNQLPSSFGFRQFLDFLLETGVSTEKIDRFLEADPDGEGTIHNRILARMTNEVMGALGQPSHLKPEDVKKVREQIVSGKPPSSTDAEVVDYSQLKGKS
ncbi:MAG: hypothetical protein HYT76_01685 [Deltaproteobacteria bacterium]|nr:hypothetical protein [Deltaproteobacteria bacterium]